MIKIILCDILPQIIKCQVFEFNSRFMKFNGMRGFLNNFKICNKKCMQYNYSNKIFIFVGASRDFIAIAKLFRVRRKILK